MDWQGYFFIENFGLTPQQKQTLVTALQGFGMRNDALNPRDRNHWRVRLDGEAVIFEAVFNADNLTVASLRARLAGIFGVDENQISADTSQNQYGDLAVFSYNDVVRLRVGVFGGRSAGYVSSQVAARQFIADFAGDWEENYSL